MRKTRLRKHEASFFLDAKDAVLTKNRHANFPFPDQFSLNFLHFHFPIRPLKSKSSSTTPTFLQFPSTSIKKIPYILIPTGNNNTPQPNTFKKTHALTEQSL